MVLELREGNFPTIQEMATKRIGDFCRQRPLPKDKAFFLGTLGLSLPKSGILGCESLVTPCLS